MKGTLVFARRNVKEILRDPTSFVFCLALPAVLLVVFRVIVNAAGGHWMSAVELVPGVSAFSLSFVMMYITLLVSKDRNTAFLTRLYTTPLSTPAFVLGYMLPGAVLGLLQSLITTLAGTLIFGVGGGNGISARGVSFAVTVTDVSVVPPVTEIVTVIAPFGGILLSVLSALPVILLFVGMGVLFGSCLSDRAAPGVSSGIITGAGLLGGAWMPLSQMGGLETFCKILPFYPATTLARNAYVLAENTAKDNLVALATVLAWAIAAIILSIVIFHRGTKRD